MTDLAKLKELAFEMKDLAKNYIEDGYDLIETDISMKNLDYLGRGVIELIERLERYEEALRFYGNGGNFQTDIWFHEKLECYFTGKLARQALADVGEE